MGGRYAAFMAALGIAYFFVLRFLGSIIPNSFTNMHVLRITAALSVLAMAAVLYFYIAFARDYVKKEQTLLKKAALWAAAGNGIVLLLYFGKLHNILNWRILPELFSARWFLFLEPILPWIASLCVFIFALVFFLEKSHDEERHLPRAKLAAMIGTGTALLLRSIIGISYLSGGMVRWASDLPGSMNFIAVILWVIAFIAMEFFFLSFSQDRDLV